MRMTILILFALLLSSCRNEPEPISYGKDNCAFCKMTIMDKKFGAELINKNGKQVKFDSGECMLGYVRANNDFKADKTLIINYANPGELIDAGSSFCLHGGSINSPMGGQLAAFRSREEAEKVQKELSGDVLLWKDVIKINF